MIHLFLSVIFATLSAHAGVGSVGHGGDTLAIEFKDLAREIHKSIESQSSKSVINLKKFQTVIDNSIVESTDEKLYLNGIPKDAINYSETSKIIFKRAAWANTLGTATRSIFVLHEYLGLMNIDDIRYDVSSEIIKSLFPGSLTCQSILINTDAEYLVHTEVLDPTSEAVEVRWVSAGYAIGIFFAPKNKVHNNKLNLAVTLDKPKIIKGLTFKGSIDLWNPYFNLLVELEDKQFPYIEIECKYN